MHEESIESRNLSTSPSCTSDHPLKRRKSQLQRSSSTHSESAGSAKSPSRLVDIAFSSEHCERAVAGGAGWCKEKVGIEGMREVFLNDVFDRMTGKEDGPTRIYGLDSLAGFGRAGIAYSLARRCYDKGILGSSLFFYRENPERSQLLFVTIAQDLAARDSTGRVHANISDAAEKNATLLRLASRYSKLCQLYPPKSDTIIVIDALDESFSKDEDLEVLFQVFQEDVHFLPPSIRLFVTSRDTRYL